MKIGVCGDIEKAKIIKDRGIVGVDYIEENMAKLLDLSDGEFSERQREYERLGLPVYSFNCFFAPDVPLYSDGFLTEVKDYGRKVFSRAEALGGKICVVGSGKARNIPDARLRKDCAERFARILTVLGELADGYGIRLAIEPLNRDETNFINKVEEAAEMAKRVGLGSVGALVDFYHFNRENESDEALVSAGSSIIHTHIAAPDTVKRMPLESDLPTVSHWADLLKKISFAEAVSIECRYTDFGSELEEKLKYLEPFRKL